MRKTVALSFALLLAPFTAGHAAEPVTARLAETHRVFFKDYCVECHNEKKQKGKLRLDNLSFALDSVEAADRWQKILNQINAGDMPPEEAKQPENATKADFLDHLSNTLVTARKVLGDARGNITMRRLNRREYKNTIRDLLGIDLRVNELPADGGAGTFDTVGSTLFMSSDQLEQYLALGRQALDEALARSLPSQNHRKMHIEVEEKTNPKIAKALEGRIDAHERYMKWTAAVDAAAQKAENQSTAAQIRAEKKDDSTHLYFAWKRLAGAPSPSDFGFTDAVHADEQGRRNWVHYVPYSRAYFQQPGIQTGTYLTIEDVFMNPYQPFRIPGDWPPGDYVVRVRLAAADGIPKERRFVEFGPQHDSGVCAVANTHEISGTMAQPQVVEIPITLSPTNERGYFFRERGSKESEESAHRLFDEGIKRNGIGPEFALWIDWIEVESTGAAAQPAIVQPHKEHREVEVLANRAVGGTYNGYYKGGYTKAKAWMDSDRTKPPRAFGLPDEAEVKFRLRVFAENSPTFEKYLADPLTQTGALLTIHNVHTEEVIALPPDTPSDWDKTKREAVAPGDYLLRVRVGALKNAPAERRFIEMGSRSKEVPFALMRTFQISGSTEAPQTLEIPVSISADGPRSFVFREKRDVTLDREVFEAARKATGMGPPSALWIDWVEWEGPLVKPAPGNKIAPLVFENSSSGASPQDQARAIIEGFAERAFRGKKPEEPFVDRLAKLFETRLKAGDTFEDAIKTPLSVVLASPGFLYLQEPGTEKKPRSLTDLELATRLSYFLWSAPPDDELLALAKRNALRKPNMLAQQVDRMIASEKSAAFVAGFVPQWLGMDRLDFFQFDTRLHHDFDGSAKDAARHEVYQTFGYLMHHGDSLCRLLKSDFVVVNGLLANYYDLPGISGDEFQKVSLPKDSPRGGLLGMAAILAMGSNGQISSPVERGAWVLRKLLHEPPPPAPPNVPQLTRLEGKLLTTRERLAAHQEQAQCAQCHRKIDPIGFGLENFNATGKWRTEDGYDKKGVGAKTWPIEPAGAFYNGPAFKDYFELRDLIAAKPEKFARGFTEALIEYALGRPFGFLDEDLAAAVVTQAQGKDFAVREFLQSLVSSQAFQTK